MAYKKLLKSICYSGFLLMALPGVGIADDSSPCGSLEAMTQGRDNLIKNPGFSGNNQPQNWQLKPDEGPYITHDGDAITLKPNASVGVYLSQNLVLKPATLYTVGVCVKGKQSVPPSLMISGDVQREKIQSYLAKSGQQDDVWTLYRFIFYTSKGEGVSYTLSGYQNKLGVVQSFKYPILVEGRLPAPLPPLPNKGQNMVVDPDFTSGDRYWMFDQNSALTSKKCENKKCYASLNPTQDLTARVVQTFSFSLAPNSTYTLTAKARTIEKGSSDSRNGDDLSLQGHIYVTIDGTDPAPKQGMFSTGGDWQEVSYTFSTGKTANNININLESYKGQPNLGEVDITNISLKANGKETYPSFGPAPAKTETALIEDFQSYQPGEKLNAQAWLLANKAWGGDNKGVASENISFATDKDGKPYLKLNVYGNQAASDKVRQGAALVTKKYYASAVYLVCARIPKNLGVVSAFWPFHYIQYMPTQKPFWNEPNSKRNTEIDWEMPTSNLDNSAPISYRYARMNNWGGQWGGEGGEDTERVYLPSYNDGQAVHDGKFHQFGIIWFSGHDNGDGTRTPGYVKWTFNKECMSAPPKQIDMGSLQVVTNTKGNNAATGASYGQDNIPYRAARFWIGDWFPGSPDKTYKAGGESYWGWGGTPDFKQDSLDLKWVAIYPWTTLGQGTSANRDAWVAESAPNAGNWGDDYPTYQGGSKPGPGPKPSGGNIKVLFDPNVDKNMQATITWVENGETKSQTITKGNNTLNSLNADVGTSINVNDYTCYGKEGTAVGKSTTAIYIAQQHTWLKCQFE